MTTISVPINGELEKFIESMIRAGKGSNKADVVRRALQQMSEDEAVEAVLRSQREIASGKGLKGDLRELAKKIK